MSLSRRDFLTNSGLVVMAGAAGIMTHGAAGSAGPTCRMPTGDAAARTDDRIKPTLVTIFLRGGADALNAFVPYGDDLYYQYRPRIAVPIKAKRDKGVLKLDKKIGMDYWGLNPYMESLKPLIEAGQCVPIVNVGSTDGTRSHFSAQDYMERAAPGDPHVTHGWLNRYLEATKKATDAPLRGLSRHDPAAPRPPRQLPGPGRQQPHRADGPVRGTLLAQEPGQPDRPREAQHGHGLAPGRPPHRRRQQAQAPAHQRLHPRHHRRSRAPTPSPASRPWKPPRPPPATPTTPAAVWATSSAPSPRSSRPTSASKSPRPTTAAGTTTATRATWTAGTARCSSTSPSASPPSTRTSATAWTRCMVLVMSEFGRTVHENGAMGTDHGRGGMMIAMSNSLNGGKFYGEHKGMQRPRRRPVPAGPHRLPRGLRREPDEDVQLRPVQERRLLPELEAQVRGLPGLPQGGEDGVRPGAGKVTRLGAARLDHATKGRPAESSAGRPSLF